MGSGELYPHTGFIVTNLALPAERGWKTAWKSDPAAASQSQRAAEK
jgi:hypothetical protein